jgi:hypothetical protein
MRAKGSSTLNSTQARIDTKDMDDISQVQEKVLVALKEITVGYARVHRSFSGFKTFS